MTPEQFAKINYDAYCESTGGRSVISGAKLPPFEETPEAVQAGWAAGAQAVIVARMKSILG